MTRLRELRRHILRHFRKSELPPSIRAARRVGLLEWRLRRPSLEYTRFSRREVQAGIEEIAKILKPDQAKAPTGRLNRTCPTNRAICHVTDAKALKFDVFCR
jgi:hypothetical protein